MSYFKAARRTRWSIAVTCVVATVIGMIGAAPAFAAGSAVSGDGTMTVTPTSVNAGLTGNQLVFTFTNNDITPSKDFPTGSIVTLTVPSGWTAPTITAGSAGLVTAAASAGFCAPGAPAISGTGPWTITVPQTCSSGDAFTITYGAGTSATKVTAPTTPGPATFTTGSRSGGPTGSAVNLGAGSPTVTVVGPPNKLAFTTSPSNSTGGTAFVTQPVVAVQDSNGVTVPGNISPVTLALTTANGATLSCTGGNPKAASSGVATFAGCAVDKAGSYTLTATDGSLTAATSASFTISVGPAAKLGFTTQPGNATGGTAFASQPVVAVQDAGGNTVTGNTSSVTLALTTAGTATLSCTGGNTLAAVASVASFTGCKVDLAGTYTLTATATSLSSATSASVTISVGPAVKLGFLTSPSSSTAGVAFVTQPTVAVQDAGGNTVTTNGTSVTLAITSGTGAPGAALTCSANPKPASAGVATFAGCAIDKVGTYTLTATATSLSPGASGSFTITAGSASKLVFTTQPGNSSGGTAFGTQPVVTVQDSNGNTVTSDTSAVTLALTTPGGATLTCTSNPVTASSGVAAFAGCKVDKSGTYTLTAIDGGLTSAVSTTFTISVGTATKLVFTTQPGNSTGGIAAATQPALTLQDAGGNTVTTDTSSVMLALTTPGGATLSCTNNPLPAVSGVASFAGCKVDKSGTYTLTATDGGLTSAISASFTISVGPAAKVGFTTSPSNSTGGIAFVTQPTVAVQDAGGNTVTTDSSLVTLALTTAGGATLSCTANPQAASSGVAAFAGCKVDKTGTYTLTATDGTLGAATSAPFTIAVGPAVKVVFTTSPSDSTGGTAFATQPVVRVQDAGDNTVTTDSSQVTLTLTTPGGATVSCTTNPLAASSGVAAFAGCKVDKTGTYTLTAADGSLTSAVSGSFTISVGPAAKLAFTTSPSNSTGGTAFATQPVIAVQDAGGNTVTTNSSSVALALTTGNGATLSCTTNPLAATSGVASFGGCKVDKTGTYTVTAADGSLTSAVSGSFTISVGPAAKLAVTTSPSNSTGGVAFATQPAVTVQDAGGNTVTTNSSSVSLALTTAGGATLSCTTNPLAVTSGVASFAGCKVDRAGSYTLTATDGGLTAATSAAFTISVGPAAKLAFTTSPSNSTGGTAFATQPTVTIQDAGGNTVASDTSFVTLALTTAGGATLTCTSNPLAATSGLATFAGCKVDKAGSYTLTATDTGLTTATGASFTITVGPAARVAFTTSPSNSTGGVAFATQPVVTVQDAGGNTVATDTSSVTLMLTTPGGATLSCTANPLAAVSGVASFAGCKVDKNATYTLTATDGALTSATSASFAIAVGPAAKLGFVTSPSNGTSGIAFPTQPVVAMQDAGGNTVTTDNNTTVTLSITSGTGTAGATLTCTPIQKKTSAGLVGFSGCKIDKAGSNYKLTATDGVAVTPGTSNQFAITPGAAFQLTFTTQPPATGTAGAALASFQVSVQDAAGNTVISGAGATDLISLSIATGPTGGTFNSPAATYTSVAASAGVATFGAVVLDTSGAYTFTPTDDSRTGIGAATSTSVAIAAAAASKLSFGQGPSDAFAGTAMTPAVTVQVQDQYGNATASSGVDVTVIPSAGVIDSGAAATTNSAGVATFSSVQINTAATGLTLSASASGLTATPASAPFNVTVQVSNGAALTDTASDGTGSSVQSVAYYYCTGLTGSCTSTNWILIGSSTSSAGSYPVTWSAQPANGSYRLVVVGTDNVTNASAPSAAIPVTIAN